jgi:hypothetical protein
LEPPKIVIPDNRLFAFSCLNSARRKSRQRHALDPFYGCGEEVFSKIYHISADFALYLLGNSPE